jgi:hypothetical protein
MDEMSESRMHEVIEQAGKRLCEADDLLVWLSNEVVPGAIWTEHEVEIVSKIHSKLRLVQMILNGDTTAEDFGLQK